MANSMKPRERSWLAREMREARMYEPRLFSDARRQLEKGSITGVSREDLVAEYRKLNTTLRVGAAISSLYLYYAVDGATHGKQLLVNISALLAVGITNPLWISVCHRATARRQIAQYDQIAIQRKAMVEALAGQRRNA